MIYRVLEEFELFSIYLNKELSLLDEQSKVLKAMPSLHGGSLEIILMST